MWASVRSWFGWEPAGVRAPWRVFWVGFVVRVAYMTVAHTWRIRPLMDHFQFGWELGRIARSVALHGRYADPFLGHTGPTAWIPPLYTLMVAAVFRVFGVYTAVSAWVVFALNSVFSAATGMLVWEMGARCCGKRVGRWSGWAWALYPAAMQYAVHWVWDMSLTAWMFAGVVVLALRARGVAVGRGVEGSGVRDKYRGLSATSALRSDSGRDDGGLGDGQRVGRWVWFGVVWGCIWLTNPSLLLLLPVVGGWMAWGCWRRGEVGVLVRGIVLAGLMVVLLVAPWVWRNWRVFGAWVPTRGNLGAELYESTRESNDGFPWGATLPLAERAPEVVRYAREGEIRYSREQEERAKARMREHPRREMGWMAKRVYFFWASVPHPLERRPWVEYTREVNFGLLSVTGWLGLVLALRRRVPGAWMFLGVFLVEPLPFYAVTVQARFRHPLEPIICVLTVFLFLSVERGRVWSLSTSA